jgi:hypothetical protein
MGDTKRSREEQGKNKDEARLRRDIEAQLDAEESPPEQDAEE